MRILIVFILFIVISGCSCIGSVNYSVDTGFETGFDRGGVNICEGEMGYFPSRDRECSGVVGCKRMEAPDCGCYCSLCNNGRCVGMSCGDRMCGDGGYVEDTGGSGDVRRVWDSGVDLDVLYCEDADLEGWVAEGMDADKAINEIVINGETAFRSVWLNEYGDLLICKEKPIFFECDEMYYIKNNERPWRIRKVPKCYRTQYVDIPAQYLCNGKDYIMYLVWEGTMGIGTNFGIVRFNKNTGEIDRIANPEGGYGGSELICQNDMIFNFFDKPYYYDENGVFHYDSERYYYNLEKGIKKKLNIPQEVSCKYDDKYVNAISCLHWDTIDPYVYNEYLIYLSPFAEEPEEMRHCIWRYDTNTDERRPILCLENSYIIQGYSPINNYILPIEILDNKGKYPVGILLFNIKTFEERMIVDDGKVLRGSAIWGNILSYFKMPDYGTYLLDLETGVKRRINLSMTDEDDRSGGYWMKGKYMLMGKLGEPGNWIVDLEKLGVIKDGHVVTE